MKHNYPSALFLLFCFFLFAELTAQRTVTPAELLRLPIDSTAIVLMQNTVRQIQALDQSLPVVEEMEFRTESDEMDFSRQEYLFRMRFNRPKSRKIQDRINQNSLLSFQLQTALLREDLLKNHYEFLIEWYYLEQKLAAFDKKKILLEDQLRIYQTLANNAAQVDVTNILKTEDDLQELERDQLDLILKKKWMVQHFLPDAEPEQVRLGDTNWITLASMIQRVDQLMKDTATTTEEVVQATEIAAAQLEYELEVAESRRLLEFVQAKYAGRNNLTPAQEFSFGIGLLLPTKSTNRVDINEAKMEQYDEEYQLAALRLELAEEIEETYQKFNHTVQAYRLLEQQVAQKNYQGILEGYQQNPSVSPLVLLQLQGLIDKQNRNLQSILENACYHYLDLLVLKGWIRPDSKINYLSDDWQSFR